MGSISFHSAGKSVQISGGERNYADSLMVDITCAVLSPYSNRSLLSEAILDTHPLSHFDGSWQEWADRFRYDFQHDSEAIFILDDVVLDNFHLALNTVSALGGDALKLLMRIHAQVEMNGWIAGGNREWVAKIIEDAPLDVFRSNKGWSELVTFLREDDSEPVIMSYSVTKNIFDDAWKAWLEDYSENNPDSEIDAFDAWTALSEDVKWRLAVSALDSGSSGLELSPDAWPIAFGWSEVTAGMLVDTLRNR